MEFCEHYENDTASSADISAKDYNSPSRPVSLTEWDQSFIDVDQKLLFGIVLAAHELGIRALL